MQPKKQLASIELHNGTVPSQSARQKILGLSCKCSLERNNRRMQIADVELWKELTVFKNVNDGSLTLQVANRYKKDVIFTFEHK